MVRTTGLAIVLGTVVWIQSTYATESTPPPEPLPSPRAFELKTERDFPIRTTGQLVVTNRRGGITVQGWPLDKVRVISVRRATALTQEEADPLLAMAEVKVREHGGNVEVSAEYGMGLPIEEKLRERREPQVSMDIVVRAPSSMRLSVRAFTGVVDIRSWNGNIEARSSEGAIRLEDVRTREVLTSCADCSVAMTQVRASVRCSAGSQPVELRRVSGKDIFVETHAGTILSERVSGRQNYVTDSGRISGSGLEGRLEFSTRSGKVELFRFSGFLSGKTESGDIQAEILKWNFVDKAFLESNRGSIRLSLPRTFSGEVDLWAVNGKASSQFRILDPKRRVAYGPEPSNRMRGTIGAGGDLLRVWTQNGDLQILTGRP